MQFGFISGVIPKIGSPLVRISLLFFLCSEVQPFIEESDSSVEVLIHSEVEVKASEAEAPSPLNILINSSYRSDLSYHPLIGISDPICFIINHLFCKENLIIFY